MDTKQATGLHLPTFGWMVVFVLVVLVIYHMAMR